jgi:hypothetical protein
MYSRRYAASSACGDGRLLMQRSSVRSRCQPPTAISVGAPGRMRRARHPVVARRPSNVGTNVLAAMLALPEPRRAGACAIRTYLALRYRCGRSRTRDSPSPLMAKRSRSTATLATGSTVAQRANSLATDLSWLPESRCSGCSSTVLVDGCANMPRRRNFERMSTAKLWSPLVAN